MIIKEIFIKENDNLFFKLIDLNIPFKEVEKDLKNISEKIYNNQIGYLQFKDKNENLFKIYILPKILEEPQTEQEKLKAKENFSKYMNLAFSLIDKYQNKLNIKEFKHIETLLNQYKKTTKTAGAVNFEELLYLKYNLAFEEIFSYFQKHKAYIFEEKSYFSQTLKHKINLRKNIKEINKTKIHQIKKETLIYSQLAYISYQVLNFFEEKILNNFEEGIKEKLFYISTKVKNLLKKKYKIHTTKKANINKMLSNNTKTLFKKPEDKKLYSYLLTLLGIEIIEKEEKDIYFSSKIPTFFISPERVYEVFVYDWLKEKFSTRKIEIEIEIKFQGKKTFYLKSNSKKIEIEKESKPDIILCKRDRLILIDCKWKIIEKIGDIDLEDILKLERDKRVWSENKVKIVPILVYPSIKINDKTFKISFSKNDNFKFCILEKRICISSYRL